MSISSTTKVSSSISSPRGSSRATSSSTSKEEIEEIDGSNNIFIDATTKDKDNHERDEEYLLNNKAKKKVKQELKEGMVVNHIHVPSAIEALHASGVYDDEETKEPVKQNKKVSLYSSYQAFADSDSENVKSDDDLDEFA